MVVETREEIEAAKSTEVLDPAKQVVHPWVLAIVFAEGDLALVAETMRIHPHEVTRFAIEHAEDIAQALYSAFKGKLITEMTNRLPDLSDGNLLKLFETVKGNPNFSVEVESAGGGGSGNEPPRFTLKMGVQRGTDD